MSIFIIVLLVVVGFLFWSAIIGAFIGAILALKEIWRAGGGLKNILKFIGLSFIILVGLGIARGFTGG